MAPPTRFKFKLEDWAIIIRGMPIALTVPKEVPIKNDVIDVIIKQNKINKLGFIYCWIKKVFTNNLYFIINFYFN